LRPAVKKLYQLRPNVSASRVSIASLVVKPKHDELRPAVSKELYQLRPKVSASCRVPSRQPHAYELYIKIWVYKMSNNLKVLTQFYCTVRYFTHDYMGTHGIAE
jgi:hypothetical protein